MLAPTTQKHLLQDVFRGTNVNQLECKSCGYTKRNTDHFYTLTLEIKGKSHIHDALAKMNEENLISDYLCEGCNKKVDVARINLLGETPNVLIIHL